MRKGAAYGLCLWLIYGIVEFALSNAYPLFTSDIQISSWQWPLIGQLFVVYAVAGLSLGAACGALAPNTGYQPAADLTLVAAFILNLIPAWPLAGSENIALLVAAALVIVLAIAIPSEDWRKRTAFLQGPWTIAGLLLASPWISRDVLHDRSASLKFAVSCAALGAIFVASWIAWRLRSRHLAALPRHAAAAAAAAAILAITLQVSGKGFQAIAAPAAGKAATPPESRPNIVLITMDTVRADHTSVYGYSRDTTPHLAEFARGATLYTRAMATGDFTLPTHASMFTGLYPAWHGANFAPPAFPLGHPLAADAITLADLLRSHGYQTAAVAANRAYLAVPMGTMKGFGVVQSFRPIHPGGSGPRYYLHVGAARILSLVEDTRAFEAISIRASDVNRRAFRILAGLKPDAPFFLFLNYMDAHTPYLPPPPYDTLFPGKLPFDAAIHESRRKTVLNGKPLTAEERDHLISQYDGGIAYMDAEIANLLNYLRQSGLYDNTLIVITSDHGEAFGEHGRLEHAVNSVYQDQIHVPLLIKYPRETAPERSSILNSQVDLMPTILSLAGCPIPSVVQGRSLLSAGSGAVFAESRPSVQSVERGILRTVLDGSLKLIASTDGSREAYDLEADPTELHNLYPLNKPEVKALEDRLVKWIAAMPPQDLRGAKLDKQTIERLKSLGYVQ